MHLLCNNQDSCWRACSFHTGRVTGQTGKLPLLCVPAKCMGTRLRSPIVPAVERNKRYKKDAGKVPPCSAELTKEFIFIPVRQTGFF